MEHNQRMKAYWRRNVKFLLSLLAAWFFFSFVCGIILVDVLNQIRLGGFKLGFWFAQQGSIYAFIVIIYFYVRGMNNLDREFEVDEE
jgi:putative solute:sodium symporter small subunit